MHSTITRLTLAATFSLVAGASYAQSSLPRPDLTPGAVNTTVTGVPIVTQANVDKTICVSGYTQTVRPPESYTNHLKRQQILQYGYKNHKLRDYEEDHLVPLALGGHPTAHENLWPEPRHPADGWTVTKKDQLEVTAAHLVCAGMVPLAEAQRAFRDNWTSVYGPYEMMWRNR